MTKELYVSSSPHETKVAVLEDEQLVEVWFERDVDVGIVGAIYKGRVSRVLPGMQSAFVDVGLERVRILSSTGMGPQNPNVPFASGGDEDSTATSLGATYNPGNWLWNVRLDYRDATSTDRWGLSTSAQTDPRSDLGLLIGVGTAMM